MSEPEVPSSRRANRASTSRSSRSKRPSENAGDPTKSGSTFARHRIAWLASALGLAFLLASTGALFAGAAVGSTATIDTPAPQQSTAPGRERPDELPAASSLRTCSVSALAKDAKLGTLSGVVIKASKGEVLFDRGGATGVAQGDLSLVLTAAAALNILSPDATLTTRVYEGGTPNSIVLVGGGDPTLSALEAGESVYTGAPTLRDLADTVKQNYPGEITSIVLDSSLWSPTDNWDSTWSNAARSKGQLGRVTALQVDGDRQNPRSLESPRSDDPIARAGVKFAEALGLDPAAVTFSRGSAVTTKAVLGSVDSQPIGVLVNQMLVNKDKTLAESLARLTSKAMGQGGTSASLAVALTQSLGAYGVPTDGLTLRDGSGLSASNSVPPAFVAGLMAKILSGGSNLNYIHNSLSIAGKSGELAKRFGGTPLAGQLTGSAGRSGTGYNLAGTLTAGDGTQLAFAFYATGAAKSSSKAALDALVAGVYSCGANLSNN